jgi:hypothetical protein
MAWTSKGILLTSKAKNQLRKNEIINTLKSMNNHFGKYKYRSGNIPFTLFGPFDEKRNVLFKDTTDDFKTNYEIRNYAKFDNNLEVFYGKYLADNLDNCQNSGHISTKISLIFVSFVIFVLIF